MIKRQFQVQLRMGLDLLKRQSQARFERGKDPLK